MGWIKDAKANTLGAEARAAYQNGDWYFAPRLNSPVTGHQLSGNIEDWTIMLRAITEVGWVLQHWSVTQDGHGHPEAYPLFVRRQ
ncbi:hypothetical protein [Actinoplanes sp. NPDC051851]|uniref:hypothetical protein n=1 Tax=Actinoplanes sp. NPDC051851 TaxID=3154753 RepID=UPI0034417020